LLVLVLNFVAMSLYSILLYSILRNFVVKCEGAVGVKSLYYET